MNIESVYRTEERAAIRAIPSEIFYGIPPRQNQLAPDPLTPSDLRTLQADTTFGKETQTSQSRLDNDNPPGMTTSSRYKAFNSANVTTVLAYSFKSDTSIITTCKLTGIEAFERYTKDSRIYILQYPNDEAWRSGPDTYDGYTLRYNQYKSVGSGNYPGGHKRT